ncbi:uncharacterized protein BDZ99DRAFT_574761 [Mytilinidion resinicola]|uniref:Uncharacterized protein n=1 Tax=Mytilinidion resinicola TaxID=574789 RepID=A0A6A6Y8J2_9PEZI|nr:uncharacterized protein BDZ99DRAFT_574761 [Mytilinidion resinicola]KAF2805151.1 hypothetical protein BDZ99DRAFT_574761 [Mytilinidion resinicola]
MSQAREDRVEHALTQLLERVLPTYPDEDEAQSDERFDNAYNFAIEPDLNHVSDLIKRKLVRDNSSPNKALNFSNLFSKLITQPVLSQKWAMLYFLYQLSDSSMPSTTIPAAHNTLAADVEQRARNPSTPHKVRGERQGSVDSPSLNEAFSNAGLRRLPLNGGSPQPSPRPPPIHHEKAERRREKPAVDGIKDKSREESPQREQRYPPMSPTEPALLRDLPFTLQGLSSTNLVFSHHETAALKLPTTLPVPLISLLHTLAEPSLLYRGLSQFVESTEGGLVGQSFRSALSKELRSYLGLVATLEGQIRQALAMLDASQPRQGIGKAGVTLKRCVIWTREPTMGLRLMSLMVEESKGKKGGQLISLIHSFSLTHGDPYVGAFAERLLAHVTRPFYDMLRQWIYDGELADPYLEFFVSEQSEDEITNTNGDGQKGGATSVWEDKYKLDDRMIPTIITEDFANKVFLIGKSLNFIRYGCGDAAWVESYSKEASKELRYGDTAGLEHSIGEAYKTTMARLISLMVDKFKLLEHLQALKKYILLGAGDFIAVLMESLSSNLDRPANTQYRHTLTAQLEHAVRNSNAQYDSPDVLRRLDSRMLELSHGEIGWDVFTLEYKIDAPVDVIVTPFGSKQYLKVFNFLWRVKRVEFALGSTWRRCMTGARGVLGTVSDKVGTDWKKARCAVAEMIHFVNQLQYYILFEVIESSWNDLQEALRKPESTLDDLIEAHAKYLTSITRKGLLGSQHVDFTSQLHELLKIMLAYKDAVDGLYSFSVAEFTRRQEISAKIETRTAEGRWGISEKDALDNDATPGATKGRKPRSADTDSPFPIMQPAGGNEDDVLPALRIRLGNLLVEFRSRVNVLLGDLYHQPDHDMRWLAMVMNFNDVYQPARRKRRTEKKKETPKPGSSEAGVEKGKGKG